MKKVVQIITLMLLFTGSSFAATHVINSLPYTFNANSMTPGEVDTLVLGASKLTSATNGITLSSVYGTNLTDVVLNLRQDTVVFGTAGGDGNYGIRVNGTGAWWPHHLKIVGGYVLHEPSDTTAERNNCLYITGNDLIIQDVNAVIRGFNAKAFYSAGQFVYNNQLIGGTYRSEVTGFSSRCNFDAVVVHVMDLRQETLDDNNAPYHYIIDGITVNGGPHAGLVSHGRVGGNKATVILRNNYVMTDARNDFYLSYSGTCLSSSNPYGIVCSGLAGGSILYNNTIVSGTERGGNRGILLEGASGVAGNPIIVRKNHVEVNEGPNIEYGDGLPVHALRIRYGPGYILVDSNTFISRGDNNPATAHIGNQVHAVRFSSGVPGVTKVELKHNTIKAISLSSSGVNCNAVTYDAVEHDSLYFTYYNNISSTGNVYKFGEGNGHSYGQVVEGDTVSFESTTINPVTFHIGHLGNNFTCDGNIAKDLTFLGGTSYDDIQFAIAGTEDITLKKTIGIQVKGNNGFNVAGATVSVVNNYGNSVLNGFTDSTGTIKGALSYWYESRTVTDSTAYNNFSLVVEKGADIYTTDMVIGANSAELKVCTLSNTAGEIDSIPPDPIDDLSCIPGSNDGQIYMSWTAVGDDASTGTANNYVVKYSTSQITDQNFEALTTVYASTPDPAVAGSAEAMILSGLTPGTVYYVAMKVYDYAGNSSALSNVSSAEAYLDLGSGGGDDTTFIAESLLPVSGSTLLSSQPTLSAGNINAPGTNSYYFEVAEDNSFAVLTAASAAVAENPAGTTTWQIDTTLEPGQTYYWRVQVNSYGYSVVSDFTIQAAQAVASTKIIAYPNPVNIAGGEPITFSLPNSPVDLLIQTVSGETVLLKKGISGNWQWDGRNSANNKVATGVYLWYVPTTKEHGKIVVSQ